MPRESSRPGSPAARRSRSGTTTRATWRRSAVPRAVADLHWIKLSGFPAWAAWLTVHLWYLVGFQNRLIVFIRWSVSFLTHGRGARLITEVRSRPAPPGP